MVILFNQRVPVVAIVEVVLAGLVLCGSFINAVSGHLDEPTSDQMMVIGAVAIFALSQSGRDTATRQPH